MPFRSIIADDHPAITDAVSRYLDDEPDVDLVAIASGGDEALALIEKHAPEIAVLDVQMPGVTGIEIARRLADAGSGVRVILYTAHADQGLLLEALDAGARGFLLKEAPLTDLVRAIRVVGTGGTYVDPGLSGVLAGAHATARLRSLSKREREILRLLADGMRNDAIAAQLAISPLTVQSHVKNAMEKLEADTRTEAVARALRDSLIT